MELNFSSVETPVDDTSSWGQYIRLINLTVSCIGVFTNSILLLILVLLGRHQCTTYFLLVIMTLCDFLYCLVYSSISLTIDSYLNIINHQILCPLSFFLTPFTFTGSTLLLFICLIHLITNYVRRYDTILGQVGGRLSVVFIFAFVIIRSVLGSTSIELISDTRTPHVQICVIDINISDLVTKVQTINHIFAEVTDILVYIGWTVLICIYITSFIRRRISPKPLSRQESGKPSPNLSFLIARHNQQESRRTRSEERLMHRQRHDNVSSIILFISMISMLFYLPVMISKFITLELTYGRRTVFSERQVLFFQTIQQTAHLFCLAIRFVPYFIFETRIRSHLHRLIGMKIQSESSSKKKCNRTRKYICRCQCSARQQPPESV